MTTGLIHTLVDNMKQNAHMLWGYVRLQTNGIYF
jgi:hypothetical protein